MEPSNLPQSMLTRAPWDPSSNPIWPASCFFLYRNIAKYPFPGKLSEKESLQLLPLLQKLLLSVPELKCPLYFSADTLSALEKEFLCEHFLSQEGLQNTDKQQAFIIDESAHFLASLNIHNHLSLQWIDCKGKWQDAWQTLSNIENSIGSKLEYAFSPKFGYLTSSPALCGTALVASCYLHLPALLLSNKLQEILSSLDESVHASGLFGGDEFIGDFLILKNKFTLGLSEESILKELHRAATLLVLAEKDERLSQQKSPSLELKDKMSRSYGLLLHSYKLDTKEALDALSWIKLGIDLGWIKGMTDEEVNELFFRCRRAHLLKSHEKISLDTKELSEARAEYLHKQLQKITLQF